MNINQTLQTSVGSMRTLPWLLGWARSSGSNCSDRWRDITKHFMNFMERHLPQCGLHTSTRCLTQLLFIIYLFYLFIYNVEMTIL